MVFGIVVILLVLIVAYFHYVQGLLSGVLSAVCAVAAGAGVGYHENVIEMIRRARWPTRRMRWCWSECSRSST